MKHLSDNELHTNTIRAAKNEQAATLLALEHLAEVQSRRLYAKRGYSSLWEYCVQALHYSEPAAAIQRLIKQEEKERDVPKEEKRQIVAEVLGKSKREAEKLLSGHRTITPEPVEKSRPITPVLTEIKFCADEEFIKMVERIKELKGPMKYLDLMKIAMAEWLKKNDPVKKAEEKQAKIEAKETKEKVNQFPKLAELQAKGNTRNVSRYIPTRVKETVLARSKAQCEYLDRITKRRCECRTRLQWEHSEPFAMGGTSDEQNIKLYCGEHNRLAAIQVFGEQHMGQFMRTD